MDKKKVLLIVNPCSGKNKSRNGTFDIVEKFSSANYDFDVRTTTCQGDATNIVKEHIGDNDLVVCCGGDGTFNETINGVMQLSRRVPIGYIPAGSTNDLAATIGLPSEIGAATDIILQGHTNRYDIGLFNNRFFSYIASFGAASALSYSTPQKLKNIFGHTAYVINGLVINLIPTLKSVLPVHARIEYDGGVFDDNFSFGSISNSTSVAGIFKFDSNKVRLDDGKFEVLLVRRVKHPLQAFGLLAKVKKMDYDGDKIIHFSTSNLVINFDEPQPWTLDGEFGGNHRDVRFSVLNRAIDVVSGNSPLFTGEKLDIPVYDVAAVNAKAEEERQEKKESRLNRWRENRKNAREEEETAEEKQETAESEAGEEEDAAAPAQTAPEENPEEETPEEESPKKKRESRFRRNQEHKAAQSGEQTENQTAEQSAGQEENEPAESADPAPAQTDTQPAE